MMIGVAFAGGLLMTVLIPLIGGGLGSIVGSGSMDKEAVNIPLIIGAALFSYAAFGTMFLFVHQYIYASTFNYSWGNTQVGPISFNVSLEPKTLAWIRFTNVLAIVFSLGFLVPWAKVRRIRYILPRISVILPGDMDVFEAARDYSDGATGDTAADFFDWDIGW